MAQGDKTQAAAVQEAVLAACAPGRSVAVLIEGAPGLGKTALLEKVAHQAAVTGTVLTAAAGERQRPFGMLARLLAGSSEPDLSGLLTTDDRSATDIGAALCSQLRDLGRRGSVTVCVDDVHHCDVQSLQALQYVLRTAQPAPVTVVAATATFGDRWRALLPADTLRSPQVHRMRLALLAPAETERFVTAHATATGRIPPRAAARLHRLSGGNPLLLQALLAEDALTCHPVPEGPFVQGVARLLRHSGPAARATAHTLAVLGGHPLDPPLLAELIDGGAPVVVGALDALRSCGLLDGLGRREPAVLAGVLADCEAPELTRLRLRVAHALHTAKAPATAVAAPLLALIADGARPAADAADQALLVQTARDLAAAAATLRTQGRTDQADSLERAARQLHVQVDDLESSEAL
ncbi:AAA family ATPase [Streptomyces sp. YC504]|uniref:AAA family ATPase n=1 Tax=Streptomyces mesophilus TaxID=1775132 RepID=A0A6G4XA86_9ACTN|nr:ATP-binding protein [Streptomyces mesophilus]NGO74435.1 AAA family ATPase [Streptomyces mesophilus]